LDTNDELRDLARRGAVGDIGLRFFDREGLTKRLQQFFGGEFVGDERVDACPSSKLKSLRPYDRRRRPGPLGALLSALQA
jgi:hypothetical protein